MKSNTTYPSVIVGLWPVAGITSVGVSRESSLAMISRAIDCGATWFDTAYSYGYDGESDRLIGEVDAAQPRNAIHVVGKVGQRWNDHRERVVDSSPASLRRDAEESLRRMQRDKFDLLMLHSIDPEVPIEASAQALVEMQRDGLTDRVGVCNVTLDQLRRFSGAVPTAAVQLPLNILQRQILDELVPWCYQRGIAVHVYWTLMKGVLAGKMQPDHRFEPGDSRPRYDIYQGRAWERTHQVLTEMRTLAVDLGTSIACLSIGWAISQPGVTSALVGGKYAWQIEETLRARPLEETVVAEINRIVEASQL